MKNLHPRITAPAASAPPSSPPAGKLVPLEPGQLDGETYAVGLLGLAIAAIALKGVPPVVITGAVRKLHAQCLLEHTPPADAKAINNELLAWTTELARQSLNGPAWVPFK